MSDSFNIFDLHRTVVGEYKDYVNSFIHIADKDIREFVDAQIHENAFWPEPLLQFNPRLKRRGAVKDLAGSGKLLHPDFVHLFKGYELYEHQATAMDLGIKEREFVVTSGTGSGKSLTYLGTIFHKALTEGWGPGIRAVLVYPMNALINSQYEEIKGYQKNYEDATGRPFPVRYAPYTGQEDEAERQKVESELPQIILTNYMMLELIMTRRKESRIRDSIRESLTYLLFDELHMYRGRQGADIAMLVRRIRAAAKNKVICLGTSATMATGTPTEQRQAVAKFAETIFGVRVDPGQVISETIEPSFGGEGEVPAAEVRLAVQQGVDSKASEEALLASPLARWLEAEIALRQVTETDGSKVIVRGVPISQTEITQKLAAKTGLDKKTCSESIQDLLLWMNVVNTAKNELRKSYLPYKVHQFISQTGSVYATLPNVPGGIKFRIEPGMSIKIDGVDYSLYPLVFSRTTGHAFYCVTMDAEKGMLPRGFEEGSSEADEDSKNGYLILGGSEVWDPEVHMEHMPDEWVQGNEGERQFTKDYAKRAPQRYHVGASGAAYHAKGSDTVEGWFMPVPLLFDPTGGVFYDPRTVDSTKLARLGMEGRSTATTVTALAVLRAQERAGFEDKRRKILSFSDNRQDAALQAGHFNDLVKVVELRHGIAKALAEKKELDHTNIDMEVSKALGLSPDDYSRLKGPEGPVKAQIENAFREYLLYRVLADLRRSWRINLPNLEQTGLLRIDYRNLESVASEGATWKDVPVIGALGIERRLTVLGNVLDHIRREFAISSAVWLDDEEQIKQRFRNITERLQAPWVFDENTEKPENFVPKMMVLKGSKGGKRYRISSAGPQSLLGRYLKKVAGEVKEDLSKANYYKAVGTLFEKLAKLGFLDEVPAKADDGTQINHYRLKLDTILWREGDGKAIKWDEVRRYTYKDLEDRPNLYFQTIYKEGFGAVSRYLAEDHTAQVNSENRKTREQKFREGAISALFCSPTMELGIDIRTLDVVHMRNVPPGPANYAQRGGRAGRSGQSALVLVTCSPWSPHDNHYFSKPSEMIAGQVNVPRIDLFNEELVRTHLHALFMESNCPGELGDSVGTILEIERPGMPLTTDAQNALILTSAGRTKIIEDFKRVLGELGPQLLEKTRWFDKEWISRNLDASSASFEKALSRWRILFADATSMQVRAQEVMRNPRLKKGSDDYKSADRQHGQAKYLLETLLNQHKVGVSEFNPWRYFAAEGFLPGYNFTRLPLRASIPVGDGSEYLSRPRFVALREFGPQNTIYHSGNKFQINQLAWNEESRVRQDARVVLKSGYWLDGAEKNAEVCPFTKQKLESSGKDYDAVLNLIPMMESRTKPATRITCEEEERLSLGYRIDTFFSVDGGMSRVRKALIEIDGQTLLNLSYIPAARIVQVNRGWRSSEEDGFYIGEKSGFYHSAKDYKKRQKEKTAGPEGDRTKEDIISINLFTTANADALYIEPMGPLSLKKDGVITLQYALLRAIEREFQIEPGEVAATLMGDPESPNIFLFEASEGSLGILSQFTTDPSLFNKYIKAAQLACRFEDTESKASYKDLLSYYNQREHRIIDKNLVKDALDRLAMCTCQVDGGSGLDYDGQYAMLTKKADPHSNTESKFLKFLYERGLRLPDDAQRKVPYIYCQPDFFYKGMPDTWVFCDGTPHDGVAQQKKDEALREEMRNHGHDVIEWHYRDSLEGLVEKRKDIFRKVK
ncbi:MAG: DEAD/DEAH box helicase [Spirochaetes bacterium]|nr:DEAD/DEAH box helicase [Spirochaetota bacterium]